MREDGAGANSDAPRQDDPAGMAEETGLMLDDELNTAASPFLYLLSALLIALGAYFVYTLLHG